MHQHVHQSKGKKRGSGVSEKRVLKREKLGLKPRARREGGGLDPLEGLQTTKKKTTLRTVNGIRGDHPISCRMKARTGGRKRKKLNSERTGRPTGRNQNIHLTRLGGKRASIWEKGRCLEREPSFRRR